MYFIFAFNPPSSNIGDYYAIFTWILLVSLPLSFILFTMYAVLTINDILNTSAEEIAMEMEESYLENNDVRSNGMNV
jgi:hypothetical protein